MIRVKWNYRGFDSESYSDKPDFIVGRLAGLFKPQVALNVDLQVQAKHARIWQEGGQWWVEDLDTRHGTFLNGERVTEPTPFDTEDTIQVGSTKLTVEEVIDQPAQRVPASVLAGAAAQQERLAQQAAARAAAAPTGIQFAPPNPPPLSNVIAQAAGQPQIIIQSTANARERTPLYFDTSREDAQAKLARLYEVPLVLAGASDLKTLCRTVLTCLTQLIPAARRGALLIIDKETNKLALRAGIPEDNPPVSRTLIKRAVSEGRAFVWNQGAEAEVSSSMREQSMACGMYCPMFWQDELVGVLCVDNPDEIDAFTDEDFRLFIAVAHYAAATVVGHLLKQELREYATVLERLMTNFSPKLRLKLVARARHSALAPGGEKSRLTLLMCDLRGFTRTASELAVEQVVAMLNEYFTELIRILFEHDGTVDKFLGDGILAVFGSPEADSEQHIKAVQAALAMQGAMRRVNEARATRGEVCCELGIGLHFGEVLHGFVGSEERLEFTVIGDAVNRTSRYCAGARGGEILISEALHEFVRGNFPFEAVAVPTKHEGDFAAFRVQGFGPAGPVSDTTGTEPPDPADAAQLPTQLSGTHAQP
jgi:adenylate cyclase